jgi:hypothetical protein
LGGCELCINLVVGKGQLKGWVGVGCSVAEIKRLILRRPKGGRDEVWSERTRAKRRVPVGNMPSCRDCPKLCLLRTGGRETGSMCPRNTRRPSPEASESECGGANQDAGRSR